MRITDIAVLAVLAGIVIAVSLHMFTPYLRLSYINSDPANHFNDAMVIVKQGVLGKHIYFLHLSMQCLLRYSVRF